MAYNYSQSLRTEYTMNPNSNNSMNSYKHLNNSYLFGEQTNTNFEKNVMQLALIQQNDRNNYVYNQSLNYLSSRTMAPMTASNETLKPDTSSTVSSSHSNRRQFCGFCRRNGESMDVFSSHLTKDLFSGKVRCPILMRHICELCGATGEDAHTRSHCPIAQIARTDPFIKDMVDTSTAHKMHNMVSLKKTRINSAGKLRKF